MSTNFYFRFENLDCEEDVPSVRLSNGDEIKYLVPDQYSYECHIGKRACLANDGSGELTFTWAVEPYRVYHRLVECVCHRYGDPAYLFAVDEYGREYTAQEFKDMLDNCVVWRRHAIGTPFC